MVDCTRYTRAPPALFTPFQKLAHATEFSAEYIFKQGSLSVHYLCRTGELLDNLLIK